MRKKRRLKRHIKIFVFILLLIFVVLFYFFSRDKESTKTARKVDYISSILSYNNELFEKDFLKWVDNNYDDVLKEIYNYLKNDSYDEKVWHELTGNSYIVLKDLYSNTYEGREDVTVIEGNKDVVSIGFAGDVSLADNWAIMPYYKSRGKGILGILSENMVNYMKNLDWMTINSEFAFSSRGSAMANKLYTFRANPSNVSIYDDMSVDMVVLANNHVYDYGQDAFYDTLDTLKNANLPYIGAGVNNTEAESAYYLVVNGYKISFLNATRAEKYILTPEATADSPGVFRCYDPTRLSERIKEEKEKSDYVVAIVHWGKENYHELEDVQVETGKIYIDSGADMVIGHHAHVLQGVEFYNGKLIAYNLGNFIFNSLSVDTGILKWELDNNGHSQFYFYPGIQSDCYTRDVSGEEALAIYNRMTNWSINASFLEDGRIVEKQN